ncbi:ribosome assembly protein METTL17, mitochondrial-like isoform X2 [Watersipora subatra]|uniref:ribosome assembly protein METTL17, mitochondrial-like isoform X2 n=1 Tax=Watersipora subatra TaxID=2589382 RepID=UPI00355BB4A3
MANINLFVLSNYALSRGFCLKSRTFKIYFQCNRCFSQQVEHTSEAPRASRSNQVFQLSSDAQIDDTYFSHMKEGGSSIRYTDYPGSGLRKDVRPPKRLIQSALTLSQRYSVNNVLVEAKKLQQYLWARQVPPESSTVQKRIREREHQLLYARLQKTDDDMLTPEEFEKVQQKAAQSTRKTTYHWRPLELDAYLSVVYMSSHLVSNYSVLYAILREIAETDPSFKPLSMLDFGSGLATSVWAVNELWDTVNEHYCWDKSPDVSTLARLLLQDGKDYADMIYPGVYFRQRLETHHTHLSPGFDLVISSHSLFELPNQRTRLEYIDKLWTQSNNYLVLAENGTVHGHRLIEEARTHILKNYQSGEHKGHVAAPCPHELPCPLVNEWMRPCNFEVTHRLHPGHGQADFFEWRTSKPQTSKKKGISTRYCYVVLKKGEPLKEDRYPRLLSNPSMNGKKCVHCVMCLPDGKVRQVNVQSSVVPKVFKVAKAGTWGTRLPLTSWECLELPSKKDSSSTATDSEVDLDT